MKNRLLLVFIALLLVSVVSAENLRVDVLCGNSVCELGENIYNCPDDCTKIPITYQTNIVNPKVYPGETVDFKLAVSNSLKQHSTTVTLDVEGLDMINISNTSFTLRPKQSKDLVVTLDVPENIAPQILQGAIVVYSGGKFESIPIHIRILPPTEQTIKLEVKILSKEISNKQSLQVFHEVYTRQKATVNLEYSVYREGYFEEFAHFSKQFDVDKVKVFVDNFSIDVPNNDYILIITANDGNDETRASDTFVVNERFWTPLRLRIGLISLAIIILAVVGYVVYKRYANYKKKQQRYLDPNYSLVPKKTHRSFWLGYIGESTNKSFWNPDSLTTHALVTGSTGSGKSVAASIFVEEALMQRIPVVVFDPTSQWTGFVKQLTEQSILDKYTDFKLNEEEARSFPGLLYQVDKPKINLDIKKYMNPGEVTVFDLSPLQSGEYDQAVMHIVDRIFEVGWEESSELRLLLVFDEVHRLLEKYGGKGGYVALEKACREFRKWGIGIIMVSQVSADFKEAVAGNILTEVQLNTKSIDDIKKVEQKYGTDYSERITRQGIAVAMVQNPKYNDGKPWFVHFRPPFHMPHKISDEDLRKYASYSARLDVIEAKIKGMEDEDKLLLELKLARTKLKEGRFRMVDIYLSSLEESMNKSR